MRIDSELALKISRYIHDKCKDVPHDIGLCIADIIEQHYKEVDKCNKQ